MNDEEVAPATDSAAPAVTLEDFPAEVLRRYQNADGEVEVPLEEIVRIEEMFKAQCHDPSRQDSKHWDGKSLSKNLPF